MASSTSATSRATTPGAASDAQNSLDPGTLVSGLSKLEAQGNPAAGAGTDQAASAPPPRLVNTTACLPIVYGSVAFYLGSKADEYNTHKWTLYLRGPNNEDLSVCIAKVVFQLHPSFAQPIRELTTPPFEVTEQGWGEFEAQIRIVWKDTGEKSTLVNHGIKLYPPGANNQTQPTLEAVVDETYDEVVFTDPNEAFYRQLMQVSAAPKIQSADSQVQESLKVYSDNDDFQKLVEAQRFLEKEVSAIKERMKLATQEVEQVDAALREVQEEKRATSAQRSANKRGASSSAGGNASKKSKQNSK